MTNPPSEDTSTAPAEATEPDEIPESQLEGVAGAGGRHLTDCEGYAAPSNDVLAPKTANIKQPE
jgi:hypothetical protein